MRDILIYPNEKLLQKSKDVKIDKIGTIEFNDLLIEMKKVLKSTGNGLALAAIQIGIPLRIFTFNNMIFINPVIIKKDKLKRVSENCLSIPKNNFYINRYMRIELEYLDKFGNKKIMKFRNLTAQMVQHEIDHMNGILINMR